METNINKDTLKANWNILKSKVKQQWSKLTDDDMGRIEGSSDELLGRIQKVYGVTKEQALKEFDEFKSRHFQADKVDLTNNTTPLV